MHRELTSNLALRKAVQKMQIAKSTRLYTGFENTCGDSQPQSRASIPISAHHSERLIQVIWKAVAKQGYLALTKYRFGDEENYLAYSWHKY